MPHRTKILAFWVLIGIGNLLPLCLDAQSSINGYVLNVVDSTPVPGVHLTINGIVRATTTAPDGSFSIKSVNPSQKLICSHIAFEEKNIKLNKTFFVIYLEPRINQLPSVSINSKPYTNIIADKKLYILDYTFHNNQLLAISLNNRKNNEAQLILISNNGDTTKSTNIENPEFVYNDCYNNHHLIEKAMASQIFIDTNTIQLIYPHKREEFLGAFENVKGFYKDKYLIRNNLYNNQMVEFFIFNSKTNRYSLLTTIIDDAGLERLSDLGRLQSSENYSEADARFEAMCFYAEKDLITIIDSNIIMIFNTVNNYLEKYDFAGNLVFKEEMDFHLQKSWDKTIIQDEITGKLFTHFTNGGVTTIYEINTQTAQLGNSTKIPGINFAQKIKVNDGKIYFLYNDPTNYNYKQLYAMNLAR